MNTNLITGISQSKFSFLKKSSPNFETKKLVVKSFDEKKADFKLFDTEGKQF